VLLYSQEPTPLTSHSLEAQALSSMSNPPQLPPLPSGFAGSSPFPPLYNSPNPNSNPGTPNNSVMNGPRRSQGAPPPLPPLPDGALAREQQLRSSTPSNNNSHLMPKPIPHRPLVQSMQTMSLSPGQLMNPPPPNQNPGWRASSPVPPPGAFPTSNSFSYSNHSNSQDSTLRPNSMMDMPTRPLSAASSHHNVPDNHRPQSYNPPPPQSYGLPNSNSFNDSTAYLAPATVAPGARRASGPVANFSNHPPPPNHSQTMDSYNQVDASGKPALCIPVPDMSTLAALREKAMGSNDENKKLAWAKQVIKFVERKQEREGGDGANAKISDPNLVRWIDEAIGTVSVLGERNSRRGALVIESA